MSMKTDTAHSAKPGGSQESLHATVRRFIAPTGTPRYKSGYKKGYHRGFAPGYSAGLNRGRCDAEMLLDGISIVIPVRDQAGLLTPCLENIEAHTPEKHEVIVIHKDYRDIRQIKRSDIRNRRIDDKAGMVGAINLGLKMARGKIVLIVSPSALIEKGWLAKLLACFHAPMQEGNVSLLDYLPMQVDEGSSGVFGAICLRSDSGKPYADDQMAGCLLVIYRDALDRIGYLDESYGSIGGQEDDFALRARMLGLELVTMKDKHNHYHEEGAVLSPESGLLEAPKREDRYFMGKWGIKQNLESEVHTLSGGKSISSADLYPTHVVVRGPGLACHWMEHGVRHPLVGEWPLPATRLSQLDLRQLAKGEPWTVEQVMHRLSTLSSTPSLFGSMAEGAIVRSESGELFQSDRGTLRRLIGDLALSAWHMERRPVFLMTEEEAASQARGLPIIAPPAILDQNL